MDICQVLYSEYQPVKMDIFDICHWKTRSYDLEKGQKRVIYFVVSFGIYNLLKSGLKKTILHMDEYDQHNLIKIVAFKYPP